MGRKPLDSSVLPAPVARYRCTRCQSSILSEGNLEKLTFHDVTHILCPACVIELDWFLKPLKRNEANTAHKHRPRSERNPK